MEDCVPKQISVQREDISGARFEDVNMSRSDFRNVNLAGSHFHDIHFSDVSFHGCSNLRNILKRIGPPDDTRQRPVTFEGMLCNSIFRKVDLSNVELIGCNIQGMTVDGVLISDLQDADRRGR